MFMDSDSGLNLGLGFDNSLQKVLTRTMLNQEEIFKNQVLELHRLYEIQKIHMKGDFKLSSRGTPHSFVGPFPENLKYESLAAEMKLNNLSEVHTIFSSGSVQNHCLKQHRGAFEHQQISLDLNLAGSQYINDGGNLSCDCITPMSSLMASGICYDEQSTIDMLKLSLRAGADTRPKGSGRKTCQGKIVCSPSRHPIHLEASTYGGGHTTSPANGYSSHSGAKNEFEASCSFTNRKTDSFGWIQESQSLRDGRVKLAERKHFHQGAAFNKTWHQPSSTRVEVGGVEKCHAESCENMSARRTLFTCPEVGELDLNKSLPDESSLHTIDSCIFNPSHCISSGVSHTEIGDNGKDNTFTVHHQRQSKNNYLTESSALALQDTTVTTLTTSPSKDTGKFFSRCMLLCSVDIGSVCGPLSHSKDHGSGCRNFTPENTESELHLPDKICRKKPLSELDVKKKKEDTRCSHYSSQELLEGTGSNRSPISCKSDLITDDESSHSKKGQHLIGMPNSNVSQNVMPSHERQSQSSDPEKEESAEVDPTVKKGAISLIFFSSEYSARNQDCGPESKKRKESSRVEKEVPETSSDSYELMVLKQQECSVDDYCVSSTPLEVTSLDKNGRGIKLKRGRRMKDFRKDILPGLASLSRQEINEDIKIMELALRSREYKKHRSQTAAGRSDCIAPVRSKRSRLSYVGQRYYS